MKKLVIYGVGGNKASSPYISDIHFYPRRSVLWEELAASLPGYEIFVCYCAPGEYLVDMGEELSQESGRVTYTELDEDASVPEIAAAIAALSPDVCIAFSIPIMPYDWSTLRDAMVGEELERRGIKTIAHSVEASRAVFEKWRAQNILRKNGFSVARGIHVQKNLYTIEQSDPGVSKNLYREYIKNRLRTLRFPVVIKPTVFGGSDGLRVAGDYEEAEALLAEWTIDTDLLIEEQIIGDNFGVEIYGKPGSYHMMPPILFSTTTEGVTNPFASTKMGPVTDERYQIDRLRETMQRMAELFGFSGCAQVDLIFSEGEWYIIEINARHSLMSQASARIEGRSPFAVFGELAGGEISPPLPEEQLYYAYDFKTEVLPEEEIRRLLRAFPGLTSVMRFSLSVSTGDDVEYCEFVLSAEEPDILRNEMRRLQRETKGLIPDDLLENMEQLMKKL